MREEGAHSVGLRRKGQAIQSSHAFIRGSGASTLPSQDERFFSHALGKDETKCGIWALLSDRQLEKDAESRGGEFFIDSSTEDWIQ